MANSERIIQAASIVEHEIRSGFRVIVVVSAMAGQTDTLIRHVRSLAVLQDQSECTESDISQAANSEDEYDTVVSTGEGVTSGMMAIALKYKGINAQSWQGWQIPILTTDDHNNARIESIETDNINKAFADGVQVIVVPGFQGISESNRITTLGRGGSDTSAVALAAAFQSNRCDIYTDVNGVYTTDPRIEPTARHIPKISYEEMLELASLGAKVLQTRSVELAFKNKIPLRVISTFEVLNLLESNPLGNKLSMGTQVCDEALIMEQNNVTGITHSLNEAKVTIQGVNDKPGVAAIIFDCLSQAKIVIDMIVQNIGENGLTDVTFSCPRDQVKLAEKAIKRCNKTGELDYNTLRVDSFVSKISIVGTGMRYNSGVAAKMFKTLAEENININVITTSEIKTSVLIDEKYTELALRSLHRVFFPE